MQDKHTALDADATALRKNLEETEKAAATSEAEVKRLTVHIFTHYTHSTCCIVEACIPGNTVWYHWSH